MKINLQLFAGEGAGVFPVHNNKFKIGIKGRASADPLELVTIADLTTFSPAIEAQEDEWFPMDQEGWGRGAVTGKRIGFAFSGKRQYGDPGNDYIAGLLLSTGQGVESVFEWEMPSGAKLTMDCIVSLTTPAGGDSTQIDNLEFEVKSDGKPTFVPAA